MSTLSIQEQIDIDLKANYNNIKVRNVLRLIKSELQREKDKIVTDSRAVKIIKAYIKAESEMLKYVTTEEEKEPIFFTTDLLNKYIPTPVDTAVVTKWIEKNIDFSALSNKMQAMKSIMQHFGTTVDGNVVKDILKRW